MAVRDEKLYYVASMILQRCNNPRNKKYYRYGARGIKCLLGNTSGEVYSNLLKVDGYKDGLQIDRIDNNGHYELGNLRWVTHSENVRNREISKLETLLSKHNRRVNFKTYCKRRGLIFEDFEESFSGSYYVYEYKNKERKEKLYYYKKRS